MMYKANDTVLYATQGVCKISEISERNLSGSRMEYYVLKPVYDEKSTIFVPVDSKVLTAKMRRVLSAGEIHALIQAMPEENTIWVENEAERREVYKGILSRGERLDLIRLIKTLHEHQQSLKEKGRKMHVTDERFMKDAEKMLHEEFAHVLDMELEEVTPFILRQIEVETYQASQT